MSKVIRISDDIYEAAKKISLKENRPIAWQINTWASSGKNEKESCNKKILEIEINLLKKYGFSDDKIQKMISTLNEGNDNE
jgi:hypothetical protein